MSTKPSAIGRSYGWKKDKVDNRDFIYRPTATPVLPAKTDLINHMPSVFDQLQLGSCVSNAVSCAVHFEMAKQGKVNLTSTNNPSRLFIYYNGRVIEGTVSQDDGLEVRDGVKSVATNGACPETEWNYVDNGSKFKIKPTAKCYTDAVKDVIKTYSTLTSQTARKTALVNGFPFVIGFTVYESFESAAVAANGMVPMPSPGEQVLGGHCVVVFGYDDTKQCYLCRNSWGNFWGKNGDFYMPYAYVDSPTLSSDHWCINA